MGATLEILNRVTRDSETFLPAYHSLPYSAARQPRPVIVRQFGAALHFVNKFMETEPGARLVMSAQAFRTCNG